MEYDSIIGPRIAVMHKSAMFPLLGEAARSSDDSSAGAEGTGAHAHPPDTPLYSLNHRAIVAFGKNLIPIPNKIYLIFF